MAKDAHDREDLLRDATGYAVRMEFHLAGVSETLFCGFRGDAALSLYWGQDEVLQFNRRGQLRRGYWQSTLIGSYRQQLQWLRRGDSGRARLTRHDLSETEQRAFLVRWEQRYTLLASALQAQTLARARAVPDAALVQAELRDWVNAHAPPWPLALHPGVG